MKLCVEGGEFPIQRMMYWVTPRKTIQRETLKIRRSESLLKRGLVFLESQVHSKGKRNDFFNTSLPGCPGLFSRQAHLLFPGRSRRHKAQSSLLWGWDPWWRKPPIMRCTSWASYWLHDGNACGSDSPPSGHASYIPSLKDEWHSTPEWLRTTSRVSASAAFSPTLRKPRAQTTVRPDSGTRQCQWKQNYGVDTGNLQMTLTRLPKFLCYDCQNVTHWYRYSTHSFKPRSLSHGLGAQNYQVIKILKLNLCCYSDDQPRN